MSYDKEVFEGKTLSKLFEEIYNSSSEKDTQIKALISQLTGMIESPGDATLIVPLIKDYLEASIKNSEHLIKMTGIVQRLENGKTTNEDGFNFEELEKWAEEVENIGLEEEAVELLKEEKSKEELNED